jgi:cytoplasmic FMR1 interacting protein
LWQNDPIIPAFPDLHLSPAAILKELSIYFQRFAAQTRLLTLPAPHELPPREAQEYPLQFFFSFSFFLSLFFIMPRFVRLLSLTKTGM